MNRTRVAGSFRDPSGSVFIAYGILYRQIQRSYAERYHRLMASGLYDALARDGMLIPHEEVDLPPLGDEGWRVIRPERVGFISYPYEWSFSQLRDAALTTLQIQATALSFGMTLKDASAYNIQFHHGRPVFIDTLSFDAYREGTPWVAYRQFCQHFLAPLALMCYTDVRLWQLLRSDIDGIPLDLAARLLPWTARLNLGLAMHLLAHARYQQRVTDGPANQMGNPHAAVSRLATEGLLDNLRDTVSNLRLPIRRSVWSHYYTATNYSSAGFTHKHELVSAFLDEITPRTVWDFGANTGEFSRLASQRGSETIAFDFDPLVVEACYQRCKQDGETHLLPLVLDLTNPSPASGWAHTERASLLDRAPVDAVLALALVHHLAIGNNVPLGDIAKFLHRCGRHLIIEFVPREDSQVQRLLSTREDIFTHYHQAGFEQAFGEYFTLRHREPIRETERVLYLMERKL